MQRNLIIANTYFQLITAINLAKSSLLDDYNDIIVTDKSIGMKKKIDKIKKSKVFNEVIYIEVKEFSSKFKMFKSIVCLLNRNKILNGKINRIYDNLFFFNYDFFTNSVFDQLIKANPKVNLNIYDEGFITYLKDRHINKYSMLLRRIFLKKNFDKRISTLYLYHPELICFKSKYELKQINTLKNEETKKVINEIFEYTLYNINQKYIFFEESFFCDNKEIDDLDIILKIAEIVGKENLVIKLHPRNAINRFEKYGIEVLPFTDIPWEIIQMNNDFSDKIFLTISSGSVLASKLYFSDNIKTYLLFNCTDRKSDMVTEKYFEYLKKVEKEFGLDNFIIPENKTIFFNQLKQNK